MHTSTKSKETMPSLSVCLTAFSPIRNVGAAIHKFNLVDNYLIKSFT
jgi:hypothetical protein